MGCIKNEVTKTIMRYMFTWVGLTVVVFGYAVAGAYLFQAIEMPLEQDRVYQMRDKAEDIEDYRTNLTNAVRAFCAENASFDFLTARDAIKKMLDSYHDKISQALVDTGDWNRQKYLGIVDDDPKYGWEMTSGFLFSATILTTIGYGHVFPITETGRLICVIYSVFAIPLMTMWLVKVTDFLAHGIQFAFHHGCCFFLKRKREREHGIDPKGISLQNRRVNVIKDEHGRPKSAWDGNHGHDAQNDSGDNTGEDDKNSEKEIPVAIPILIFAVYLILGTAMFHLWEGWTFIQSLYFGIITLTTVGFGDLVPGQNSSGTHGKIIMAIASLYIIFGIAMLAAVFKLVGSSMRAKGRRIAAKKLAKQMETKPDTDSMYPHGHRGDDIAMTPKPYTY